MSNPWIIIVGLGEDGLDGISSGARTLLAKAEVIFGGSRHLAMIPAEYPGEKLAWRTPLGDSLADIRAHRGARICVLASGDPMSYGIGVTLVREFGADALTIFPAVGAFSLICARMGWSLETTSRLSLHGRPIGGLAARLAPDARIAILTENGKSPAKIAEFLCHRGYQDSIMDVFAHLGGPAEYHDSATAADWLARPEKHRQVPDLNIIALQCRAGPSAVILPLLAGLPDEVFRHDGQLTKREVRAASLARLAPQAGALLWDIGAGCGSVAIEWVRAGGRAIAVEQSAERVSLIADNADQLGAVALEIIHCEAGALLSSRDQDERLAACPDAIFLGGGLGHPDLAEQLWAALVPGGRFVANAVTAEGEVRLLSLHGRYGGEMARISVSRLVPVGAYHGWKPFMTVSQWAACKCDPGLE